MKELILMMLFFSSLFGQTKKIVTEEVTYTNMKKRVNIHHIKNEENLVTMNNEIKGILNDDNEDNDNENNNRSNIDNIIRKDKHVTKDNDYQVNKSKNADKDKDKEHISGETTTKAASDYPYLDGYNLSDATYSYSQDEDNYGDDIRDNMFIPQGLSQDKDGNLLISMYHGDICTFSWEPFSSRYSIIVQYSPSLNKILNIFTLDNLSVGSHVGGVGYYHKSTGTINPEEWIFVSSGENIKVYKLYYKWIGFSRVKQDLQYVTTYNVGHATSTMTTSLSNDYLWVADYIKTSANRHLTGYKIEYDTDINRIKLTKKYKVNQPKFYIQGMYCDSDPELEDRLKFYFTASANVSYVYQAILAKDSDNDGFVDDETEYYWESYYTPYGYTSGTGRKLPDGGEGITMKDGKLWMLNEGATYFYCDDWGGGSDVDCAREILVIDPVYFYAHKAYEVFPSGSIEITGTDIGNGGVDYGYKTAVIFSQNKQGKLYYSIGEFQCFGSSTTCKMYLVEPSTPNPIGKQYNYSYYYSTRAVTYIEDIVGIYFMNISSPNYPGNSDDFKFTNIKFTFDDNYFLGNGNPYSISKDLNAYFGDDLGDYDTMEYYFQFRFDNGPNWDEGDLYYNPMYGNVFTDLTTCLSNLSNNRLTCRNNALDNMETYLQSSSWWFLLYRINRYISRLVNITL